MSEIKPVKVGLIGCGNISSIYFKNCARHPSLDLVACADLVPERACGRRDEFGAHACSVDELLADPEIEIVLNLTIPNAHFEVGMAALEAGKSVYSEKPLSANREQGRRLLAKAREKGLLVGCAPDTFLGGGIQTCRKLIDDGWIGEPVAATGFMMGHGPEGWHPDPIFFYKRGAGPMFDMGPYYITALVNLIAPVKRVSGSARITFPQRTVTSEPKFGTIIDVEIPTHVAGVLDFANGAIGTLITSFDVWAADLPRIEIYGTEGSLSVPDPNTFGGPIRIRRAGAKDWADVPLTFGYAENGRAVGLADMAQALRTGRPHRASGDLAFHVLDVMESIHDASREERYVHLEAALDRPAPLPLGLKDYVTPW